MFIVMKTFLANLILIVLVEFFLTGGEFKTLAREIDSRDHNTAQFAGDGRYNSQELRNIEIFINKSITALQNENLNESISYLHPNSPQLEATRELTKIIFDMYDLNYEINSLDIIDISDDQAKIRVTQTTTKISGAEFRDNQTVAVHTLRKYQGQWKFFLSEIQSIEYLN